MQQKLSISTPTRAERARNSVGCKAWRRENLEVLLRQTSEREHSEGLPVRGSGRRMAIRLGVAPTALSNMVRGAKSIGDAAARLIEIRLELAAGALDIPPLAIVCRDLDELAALHGARQALIALT